MSMPAPPSIVSRPVPPSSMSSPAPPVNEFGARLRREARSRRGRADQGVVAASRLDALRSRQASRQPRSCPGSSPLPVRRSARTEDGIVRVHREILTLAAVEHVVVAAAPEGVVALPAVRGRSAPASPTRKSSRTRASDPVAACAAIDRHSRHAQLSPLASDRIVARPRLEDLDRAQRVHGESPSETLPVDDQIDNRGRRSPTDSWPCRSPTRRRACRARSRRQASRRPSEPFMASLPVPPTKRVVPLVTVEAVVSRPADQ